MPLIQAVATPAKLYLENFMPFTFIPLFRVSNAEGLLTIVYDPRYCSFLLDMSMLPESIILEIQANSLKPTTDSSVPSNMFVMTTEKLASLLKQETLTTNTRFQIFRNINTLVSIKNMIEKVDECNKNIRHYLKKAEYRAQAKPADDNSTPFYLHCPIVMPNQSNTIDPSKRIYKYEQVKFLDKDLLVDLCPSLTQEEPIESRTQYIIAPYISNHVANIKRLQNESNNALKHMNEHYDSVLQKEEEAKKLLHLISLRSQAM